MAGEALAKPINKVVRINDGGCLLVTGFLQLVSGFNQCHQVNDQKKIRQILYELQETGNKMILNELSNWGVYEEDSQIRGSVKSVKSSLMIHTQD